MNNKELVGLLREAACRADIEMSGVDGAYVVSRISTVIETLEKAAEGVEELETKLAAAEDELAKHRTVTEYYAESRRGDRRYSPARIAWELERTAMGDGHYGNALRVAKDLPGVTPEDRSLLDRYATGKQGGTDHVAIQELAMRIYAAALDATRSEV